MIDPDSNPEQAQGKDHDDDLVLRVALPKSAGLTETTLDKLGETLEEALAASGAGEFEGEEFDSDGCVLYFATPDRAQAMAVIRPLITRTAPGSGAEFVFDADEPDGTARERREPV